MTVPRIASIDIEKFFNTDDKKRFHFPGKIFVGAGMASDMGASLKGHRSVALVIDSAFVDGGLHRAIAKGLEGSLTEVAVVKGMPITQEVIALAEKLEKPLSAIVSVGGGSATDTAKATIAQLIFGDINGIGLGTKTLGAPRNKPLFVSIPTTGGSGAEASRYYVTYDRNTKNKVFGRSWSLVADWIILDPAVLEGMPAHILAGCAFDAFMHFFETLICRYERSSFGEMLSLHWMVVILQAVHKAIHQGVRDTHVHSALLEAGTMGGVAISNARTGSIHEAAGALLEHTSLTHAETLFVFFRTAVAQYRTEIADRENLLVERLRQVPAFANFASLDDVIDWWESIFSATGILDHIRRDLSQCQAKKEVIKQHIFTRVFNDKVWITKESPRLMDEALIHELIDVSLGSFGLR
jgi:alcohol dehydrogenase class IV